jgi:hypothetical protein
MPWSGHTTSSGQSEPGVGGLNAEAHWHRYLETTRELLLDGLADVKVRDIDN